MTDDKKPDGDTKPAATSAPARKRETVTLKAEHKHGGVLHPAGAKIDVTPSQKERLQRRGTL